MNAAGGTKSHGPKDTAEKDLKAFPQHPGEDARAHAAQIYWEQVEARLATLGLLSVAEGGLPDEAKCIVDVDLSLLPMLPKEHRDYGTG